MTEESRRYVLLISEEMEATCFPGDMLAELHALHPWHVVRSANGLSDAEWHALLRECEILCGPWGIRELPATTDPADLPRFLCYMCGAVGGFCNETHLALGMRLTNWGSWPLPLEACASATNWYSAGAAAVACRLQ